MFKILWSRINFQLTEGAEDILYELAAVYSSAAPAAELFRAKSAAYITAPGCPHANGGMLSGCGGSVGLNTNIMVIMEVAGMLRSALPQ